MFDTFFAKHREIQTNGDQERLSEGQLKRIKKFATFPAIILNPLLFDMAHDAETFEHAIELHVKSVQRAYLSQIDPMERKLCEIVILHKQCSEFPNANTSSTEQLAKERLAKKVGATILKQRLILLFLDLDPKDAMRVYYLGNDQNMRESVWKKTVVEAASCARTIHNFLAIPECGVFLPSVEETFQNNVDLIVFNEKGDNWCVNVQPGFQKGSFHFEHVARLPHHVDNTQASERRRKIYVGTQHVSDAYNEPFLAALAIVGQTNGEAVDLTRYPEEQSDLAAFINFNQQTPKTPTGILSLAANNNKAA